MPKSKGFIAVYGCLYKLEFFFSLVKKIYIYLFIYILTQFFILFLEFHDIGAQTREKERVTEHVLEDAFKRYFFFFFFSQYNIKMVVNRPQLPLYIFSSHSS